MESLRSLQHSEALCRMGPDLLTNFWSCTWSKRLYRNDFCLLWFLPV